MERNSSLTKIYHGVLFSHLQKSHSSSITCTSLWPSHSYILQHNSSSIVSTGDQFIAQVTWKTSQITLNYLSPSRTVSTTFNDTSRLCTCLPSESFKTRIKPKHKMQEHNEILKLFTHKLLYLKYFIPSFSTVFHS